MYRYSDVIQVCFVYYYYYYFRDHYTILTFVFFGSGGHGEAPEHLRADHLAGRKHPWDLDRFHYLHLLHHEQRVPLYQSGAAGASSGECFTGMRR